MEIWIKSQDGYYFGVVSELSIQPTKNSFGLTTKSIDLGVYRSVKRCKEIMNDIIELIKPTPIIEKGRKPNMSDEAYAAMIKVHPERAVIDKTIGYETKSIVIYEMPKE